MRRLLIFLKEPVAGQVKTRLADALGPEAACRVYRRCVEMTLARLSALREETALCVDPAEAVDRIPAWLGPGWRVLPQRGATLGERLAHASDAMWTEGARRLVILGTDSPWIDRALVEQAFTALQQTELVLGPTSDGGYYLIGLSRRMPALFQGIPWSTARVFAQTLARARGLGLTVSLLREGYDIDRPEDLRRWRNERRLSHA